jgi:hypothetical protein
MIDELVLVLHYYHIMSICKYNHIYTQFEIIKQDTGTGKVENTELGTGNMRV